MTTNVIINAMGTKEDIQKLFDTLCEPNKYNETGIRLDCNSIHPVESTTFPLWEAKGETDKMPKDVGKNDFKDLYTDFPVLSMFVRIYFDVKEMAV
ncbi:MAG: hypothetical protein LBI14_00710 [Treponema sp.]|jgi:hypothetical protein|nr:hypothetical protein [Treponema sp.]